MAENPKFIRTLMQILHQDRHVGTFTPIMQMGGVSYRHIGFVRAKKGRFLPIFWAPDKSLVQNVVHIDTFLNLCKATRP